MAKTSYITYLNNFWRWRRINEVSHSEADLYFAILDCFNTSGWKKSLTIPNSTLIFQTASSKTHFVRAREKLIEKSLIKYKKGRFKHAGTYELLPIFNGTNYTAIDTTIDTLLGTVFGTAGGTIYNTNNYIKNNTYKDEKLGQPLRLFTDDYDHDLLEGLTRK